MRRTTGCAGFALAAAMAALLAGCGGGSGPGGTDAPGDVPDGVAPDGIDADVTGDVPRPDVPPDAGDTPDPGGEVPGDVDAIVPCDATEAMSEGRDWLEKAEPGFARNAFAQAVAACPDDVDARFGAALSEIIYGSELFVSALTVATGQGTGPQLATPPLDPVDDDASQNAVLAAKLHSIFTSLRGHFAAGLGHLEAIGERDLEFRVDAVPVYLGIHPNLLFHGRFDRGDVLLMRAVASLVVGLLDTLAGQDLDTDVMSVIAIVRNGIKGDVDFVWISRFVAYLMNQDARFLSLHPGEGTALFEDARRRLSDVGPLLAAAIEEARLQGSGTDQVSWIEDQEGAAVLNVRSRVKLADDGKTPVEEPWYLILGDSTMAAFQDASRSILTPGARITLHAGVMPVLSTVVIGFVRVGLLDVLGITLPGGLDLSALEVDDLTAVLKGLMPNVMAFDWGAFYSTPVGLRAWLPAVTTDRGTMQDAIVAEWECPGDLGTDGYPNGKLRLLCTKGAATTDGPHFAGTEFATEADGIESTFPVLAFPDPSLSGLAYVDLAGIDGNADPSAYVPATGTTLNAALARMLAGVLSLLGS